MASALVILSFLVVAQGLKLDGPKLSHEDPTKKKRELKHSDKDISEEDLKKDMKENAVGHTAFLRQEIRELLQYKAKKQPHAVRRYLHAKDHDNKVQVQATQKFRLFKQKDGMWKTTCAVRGLALGGWFVPEKFINIHNFPTPDMPKGVANEKVMDTTGTIYEGSNAPDMCSLSKEIGRQELDARFQRHLNTFITEKDFEFIAKTGVNTLRIPIGYWNVVEDPYKLYAPINPANSLALMDKSLEWAKTHGLSVIFDLHSSPGSQNGWEHSGCAQHGSGLFEGGMAKKNQALSVVVAEKLAERFGKHPSLLGIQIINEPKGYSDQALMDLYRDSYEAIRKHAPDVWVIVYAHKLDRVAHLARDGEKFHNLILDKHEYACFGDGRTGGPGPTYSHHRRVTKGWKRDLVDMNNEYPTILGEWSLCHGGGVNMKLTDWNLMQQTTWLSSTIGSVFWTYKTLTDNARWSYRVALDDVDIWGELPTCVREPDHKKKAWISALSLKHHEDALHEDKPLDAHHSDVGYEWEHTWFANTKHEEEDEEEWKMDDFVPADAKADDAKPDDDKDVKFF